MIDEMSLCSFRIVCSSNEVPSLFFYRVTTITVHEFTLVACLSEEVHDCFMTPSMMLDCFYIRQSFVKSSRIFEKSPLHANVLFHTQSHQFEEDGQVSARLSISQALTALCDGGWLHDYSFPQTHDPILDRICFKVIQSCGHARTSPEVVVVHQELQLLCYFLVSLWLSVVWQHICASRQLLSMQQVPRR